MNRITLVLIAGTYITGCAQEPITFGGEDVEIGAPMTVSGHPCSSGPMGPYGEHTFYRMSDYADSDAIPGNPVTPAAPASCDAWATNTCADLVKSELTVSDAEAEYLCMGMASALLAQLMEAQSTNGVAVTVDAEEVCEALNAEPPMPAIAPVIGNDPTGVICDPSTGPSSTAYTCESDVLSQRMDNAQYTVAVDNGIEPYNIEPPEVVRWLDFDYHPGGLGSNDPPPQYQASLIWVPTLMALRDETSPTTLLFQNSSGIGAASILGVGYEVEGPQRAVNCFQYLLDHPDEVTPWPTALLGQLTLRIPTMVEYRQDMDMRFWYAGVYSPDPGVGPSERPLVMDSSGNAQESGAYPWRFLDSLALIDPMPVSAKAKINPDNDKQYFDTQPFGSATIHTPAYTELSKMSELMGQLVLEAPDFADDSQPAYIPVFTP